MVSVVVTILGAIYGYATSVWSTLRIAFGMFNTETMVACGQLLTVIFIIGVADNLPKIFSRAKERVKPKRKDIDADDEDEFEWIRIRKRN